MYFFYFYPVGINAKKHCKPVLSWALMVLMLVTFLWSKYYPEMFSLNPADLTFYPGSGHPWTVLTAIFMHAGWLHLVGNLIYFNVFAPVLESRVGGGMFVLYFIVLGVFGNLVHGAVASLGWFGQYGVGVLGASGGIAGLLAFSLIRFHHSRVDVAWWVFAPLVGQNKAGRTKVPLLVAVGLWLMLQVTQSLVASQTGASVSFGAHFGGFFMGLILALFMGHWREGQKEGLRLKAADSFRQGAFHASVGYWLEFLAKAPEDNTARLELARAQVLTERMADGELSYRKTFNQFMRLNEVDNALAVFQEASRANLVSGFGPGDLAQVAHFQEKQLDFLGAASTYQRLFEANPGLSEGERSLVRLVMLHRKKINKPGDLCYWRKKADEVLPEGGWRHFLEDEFKQEGGLGATELADYPSFLQSKP